MLTQDQTNELRLRLYELADANEAREERLQIERLVSSWLDRAVAAETERCAGIAEGKATFWRSRYKDEMARALDYYAAELRAGKEGA